jgi:hypothetical protein
MLWLGTVLLLAALLAAVYTVHERARAEREREAQAEKVDRPKRAQGQVVKVGAALARLHGLKDEPAQACTWQERVPVYGRVVVNPLASAELRCPFPGTLRADAHHPWPAPGTHVRAGQVLGWVDVRVAPQERLDLQLKLTSARSNLQGAERVYKVQQGRLERYGGAEEVARLIRERRAAAGVSLRDLEEALVDFTKAQTELASAKAAVELWQTALAEIEGRVPGAATAGPGVVVVPGLPPCVQGLIAAAGAVPLRAWSRSLRAPLDAEVTEVAAAPGVIVEAGGLVLRLDDFRRPLVLLDVPPEAVAAGPDAEVDLVPVVAGPPGLRGGSNPLGLGTGPPTVRALRLGPAARVDPGSQFAGYLYQVHPDLSRQATGVQWRPPLAVKAFLSTLDGKQRAAVSVPDAALLYHQGRALVYVRLQPGKYERREVQVLGRQGDGWALASGVKPGEPVVCRNAQLLLAEEFLVQGDND